MDLVFLRTVKCCLKQLHVSIYHCKTLK